MKQSKKGQAGIVIMVLIVLIVIVLGLVVWNFVIPIVKEQSENVETSQSMIGIKLDVQEVVLFTTGALRITVRRELGQGEIDGLKFVFYDDTGANYIETIQTNLLQELETKTYSFGSVSDIGKVEKVSVVPIFKEKLGLEFESEIDNVLQIPGGLISWWRFDNEQDFVGGNNGVLNGGASFVGSRLVSTSAGDYFEVLKNTNLDISDKLAISFWIKTSMDSGVIIEKGDNYRVFLINNNIGFSFSNGEVQTVNGLNSGWNHIVVSMDINGVKKIYINNELEVFQGSYVFNPNDDSLIIGEVSGEFDEVMFFNEPLADSEISAIYNNQKGNFD